MFKDYENSCFCWDECIYMQEGRVFKCNFKWQCQKHILRKSGIVLKLRNCQIDIPADFRHLNCEKIRRISTTEKLTSDFETRSYVLFMYGMNWNRKTRHLAIFNVLLN